MACLPDTYCQTLERVRVDDHEDEGPEDQGPDERVNEDEDGDPDDDGEGDDDEDEDRYIG